MREYIDKVSVVIATFNSEGKLPKILTALRNQDYPQEFLEIIVVDGGSTDSTLQIASKYGCLIYHNPKTEPVNAKFIGAQKANGKYLVTVDHDEEFENKSSIRVRIEALQAHPECKVAFCSGYKCPKDYPALNQYISEFGDPFSLFVYYFSKDYSFYEKTLRKNYTVKEENKDYEVVSFVPLKKSPIIELCCMGTIIDLDYFKKTTAIVTDRTEMVHLFYIMLEHGVRDAVLSKYDPLIHYSADSLKAYFPKLKWRVCNNVHFAENGKNGFNGRQRYATGVKYKKYGFILYTIFIPACGLHSVWLAITRKNLVYLLHPVFCFYVLWEIAIQTLKKAMGFVPEFTSYDGKKIIK